MPILEISLSIKLISAQLPAPSITTTSYFSSNSSNISPSTSVSCNLYSWYSFEDISPTTFPLTMTWLLLFPFGFNSMGFISAIGSIPQASACDTCALPISNPSFVIKELRAIFWALNGITL